MQVSIARGLADGEHRVRITALGEGAALDGFIVRRRVSYQVERIVWGSAIGGALLVMGHILRRR